MLTTPISASERLNFQTLISAVQTDRVCLLSAFDTVANKPATLLCAVNLVSDANAAYEFVPLAVLCSENPYERHQPPTADTQSVTNEELS